MPRNDSTLHTGMTSQQASKVRERRLKTKEEKEIKKSVLLPAGTLVDTEIKKHITSIRDELRGAIDINMEENDIKSLVLGLRLAESKMLQLNVSIQNLLKDRKEPEDE